MTYLQNI